jgi:hypothetical protein
MSTANPEYTAQITVGYHFFENAAINNIDITIKSTCAVKILIAGASSI